MQMRETAKSTNQRTQSSCMPSQDLKQFVGNSSLLDLKVPIHKIKIT